MQPPTKVFLPHQKKNSRRSRQAAKNKNSRTNKREISQIRCRCCRFNFHYFCRESNFKLQLLLLLPLLLQPKKNLDRQADIRQQQQEKEICACMSQFLKYFFLLFFLSNSSGAAALGIEPDQTRPGQARHSAIQIIAITQITHRVE